MIMAKSFVAQDTETRTEAAYWVLDLKGLYYKNFTAVIFAAA
jgi:hypothetical protein